MRFRDRGAAKLRFPGGTACVWPTVEGVGVGVLSAKLDGVSGSESNRSSGCVWYESAGPTLEDAMDCVSYDGETSAYLVGADAGAGAGADDDVESLTSKLAREMPPGNLGGGLDGVRGEWTRENVLGGPGSVLEDGRRNAENRAPDPEETLLVLLYGVATECKHRDKSPGRDRHEPPKEIVGAQDKVGDEQRRVRIDTGEVGVDAGPRSVGADGNADGGEP
jgi:hypothetical protein